jgi:NADP-dependent 3-hydroxy acid dehydrogenase YdfG
MALDGKVAWVTGAGTGIGQAIAMELARAGATVAVSGRRKDVLDAAVKEIAAADGKAAAVPLDVSDKAAVASAAGEILQRHGRIDILVNCAGTNVVKRLYKDLSPEDWDKVMGINLDGALYCMSAALPSMREHRNGLVINVSSWLGRWPGYLGGAAYAVSKHAMAAMIHQLNIEEGVNGIRGCVIYPGEVATPMLKARPVPPAPQEVEKMLKVEDLARTVRFVAEAPQHVCFNEIVISPTWNRLILGGDDIKLGPPRP